MTDLFEVFGSACGDIESLVHWSDTIAGKFLVRLNEVVVRTNLDGMVTLVGDFEFDVLASSVDNDALLLRDDRAREVRGICEMRREWAETSRIALPTYHHHDLQIWCYVR